MENLEMGAWTLSGDLSDRLEAVFYIFPDLRDKRQIRAGNLSGGQRQMVAFGSALIVDPKILLLDEPSAGLSPKLVQEMFETIRCILFFQTVAGLPIWAATILGMVATALVAWASDVVVFKPLRQRSLITLLIVSIAVAFILENIIRFVVGNDIRGFDVPPLAQLNFRASRSHLNKFGWLASRI